MSEDKPAEEKKEIKRPTPRVFEGELQTGRAEFARTIYVLTAKAGAVPEDYAQPEAYAHVMGTIKARDRFEVTAEDNTWFAEILVLDCEGRKISLAMLRQFHFEHDVEAIHEEYEAKFAGAAKWRVMRKSDNTVMVERLGTKSEAVAWIEANAKAPLKQAA